jgi:hypothetical protein
MFAYGFAEVRANGRLWIKVEYSQEMQMSCLEVGDQTMSIKTYLPTHKLSELLLAAYEAQTNDVNAIGTDTWLGKNVPVSTPHYHKA